LIERKLEIKHDWLYDVHKVSNSKRGKVFPVILPLPMRGGYKDFSYQGIEDCSKLYSIRIACKK
jgi:hypothetical protein